MIFYMNTPVALTLLAIWANQAQARLYPTVRDADQTPAERQLQNMSRNKTIVSDCCEDHLKEFQKAQEEVNRQAYLSLKGRPVPNLEEPAVAYAHQMHCEEVVCNTIDQGKPDTPLSPEEEEMNKMHFAHCSDVVKEAVDYRGQEMTEECSNLFPQVANELLGISFGYSFKYGYKFGYSFFTRETELTPMSLETIAASNFADILMKQYKGKKFSGIEQEYVKSMRSDLAKALSAKARQCK